MGLRRGNGWRHDVGRYGPQSLWCCVLERGDEVRRKRWRSGAGRDWGVVLSSSPVVLWRRRKRVPGPVVLCALVLATEEERRTG